MKKTLLTITILAVIVIVIIVSANQSNAPANPDLSGEVQISYSPESARALIEVDSPKAGAAVSSPLKITGKARGNWYFEATFPVILVDWDGLIIAEGYATAKGDWMTTEFVPFEATLDFTKPAYTGPQSIRGALILKKDNPSGLPQNDAAAEIPIVFK